MSPFSFATFAIVYVNGMRQTPPVRQTEKPKFNNLILKRYESLFEFFFGR